MKKTVSLSDLKAAKEITDVAVVMIGQAVFTSVDQYMKRHMKSLEWFTGKWKLVEITDKIPSKIIAKYKKKEFGGPGIVVIKDVETGKLAVTSTVDLAIFITEFSYHNLDSGKYGKGAQKMKVVELFVHECESTSSARNGANKLRTRIKNAGLAA